MAVRKPQIVMEWVMQAMTTTLDGVTKTYMVPRVNWKLVGANGETMCQCNQGFRDKTDALRNVLACGQWLFNVTSEFTTIKPTILGPGRKDSFMVKQKHKIDNADLPFPYRKKK